ncbi:uncharacterized protein LJ206_011788 isoform 2-T3 [Theristicus caerulescens]
MKSEIKNGELKLKSYRMKWVYPASYMGRPNVQLEDQKTIVQQHRQPSVNNQNVSTAEEARWRDAFVALKSDFIELEKKSYNTRSTATHNKHLEQQLLVFWKGS